MKDTMVPNKVYLPDVLPTECLNSKGMALPPLRLELRKINDFCNTLSVSLCYLQAFVAIGFGVYFNNVYSYAIAFVLMGSVFARFSLLAHEFAHRLLFSKKIVNDFVGKYLLSYPAMLPFVFYRLMHLSHHKSELGENEPDMNLYRRLPVSQRSLFQKLFRDLFRISAIKILKSIFKATAQQMLEDLFYLR